MTKNNNDMRQILTDTLDMSDYEVRKNFIQNNESSIYGGKNEENEDVMVFLEKGLEMTIKTFQNNGWLRVNYYTADGYSDGETFEGRWDK